MNDERRTIVGGRSRSNSLVGDFPRGIEILLKKANVDSGFHTLLLQDPLNAASSIKLDLKPVEMNILRNTDKHILRKMIASTKVPKQHIRTFRTARSAAVLLLLLSSTVIIPAGGTKGVESMPALEFEQVELAETKMSAVQDALEAYRIDNGRYPGTREWFDTPGPLSEYISHSDLFDPWKRRFHYKAVKEGGEIINYKLESLGLDPDFHYDNIPCPMDIEKHRFTNENPIRIVLPWDGHKVVVNESLKETDILLEFKAEHQNENVVVDWYLDGEKVGSTVKDHTLTFEIDRNEHSLLLVDENEENVNVKFIVEKEWVSMWSP